jgi:ATP adenylyltransferase
LGEFFLNNRRGEIVDKLKRDGNNLEKNFREYRYIDKMSYVSGKKSDECIFCNPKELIIYQTEEVVILLNKFPYNPGHLLIAPKTHVAKFEEMVDSDVLKLMKTIQKAIKLLEKVSAPSGVNIGLNQGKTAGASIIEHLHFHVVPRYDNELGFMDVIGGTRMIVENMEDTLKKLKENVKMLMD